MLSAFQNSTIGFGSIDMNVAAGILFVALIDLVMSAKLFINWIDRHPPS